MAETSITPHTTTVVDWRIPTKWDEWVLFFREKNLKAANFFRRRDAVVSENGDTVYIPQISERTATTFTEGGSLYDSLDPQTDTGITLSINVYSISPFMITDRASQQSAYNERAMQYQNSAYAIAKKLDTDVLANASSSTLSVVNSTGSTIDNQDITEAFTSLNENDVPMTDRKWFFHPRCLKDLYDLTGNYFTSIDFRDTKPLQSGEIGMILGSPVVITTNVATANLGSPSESSYQNVYAHKDAIALGMQWTPEVQEQYILERQGTLCNVRALYGDTCTRTDHVVQIKRKVS